VLSPNLPPAQPERPRRRGCTVALLVLVGLLLCGGCLQGIVYRFVPPYTWKGWVDNERKVPPPAPEEPAPPPAVNAYDTYARVLPMLTNNVGGSIAPLEIWRQALRSGDPTRIEAELPKIRTHLAAQAPVLDALRKAADQPFAWPTDIGPQAAVDQSNRWYNAVRTAVAQASVDHLDGQDDRALRTLEDGAALAVWGVADEAPMSFASALEAVSASAIEIIVRGAASDAALRGHLARVRELRSRLPRSIVGRLTLTARRIDAAAGQRRLSVGQRYAVKRSGAPKALTPFARLKADDSRVWLRDRYARMIEEAAKPVGERKLGAFDARADQDIHEREDIIAGELLMKALPAQSVLDNAAALLAGEEIACALELYRRERGAYPDALASLTPAYLPEVPLDPYTGRDFVYKVTPEGYTLYALGPDEVDDGGLCLKRGADTPDLPIVGGRYQLPHRDLVSFLQPEVASESQTESAEDDGDWSG
jgi:hypothetical protein